MEEQSGKLHFRNVVVCLFKGKKGFTAASAALAGIAAALLTKGLNGRAQRSLTATEPQSPQDLDWLKHQRLV